MNNTLLEDYYFTKQDFSIKRYLSNEKVKNIMSEKLKKRFCDYDNFDTNPDNVSSKYLL